jgi:serine O-acetyltransferase
VLTGVPARARHRSGHEQIAGDDWSDPTVYS